MNQIKNKIQKSFTIIPNQLIEDNCISDRGRFLFVYLASRPNDWTFYNKQLCRALVCSEDTLRKYMNELADKGWLTRLTKRRELGKFVSNIYIIHEKPNVNYLPYRKKTDTVKTVTEKNRHGFSPKHTNTNIKQKGKINNNKFYKSENHKISVNPRK
ncbi:helix-turn-helix domain-containing protein [Polaribacter sp. Q13]|uniref:helix-turn-helix domain-containing protein n=1 Tax=Polaribacter sp. Q13 TaxID=2806551 RepID=UPI00193BF2B7|nr:helix-turn-helix domain-containing protein [Polaribacter sp. Q13]QVY64606.1 helix-turn-helix domain-containing protein [Polaribacter sp. Q13]